jgi:hypothetical protein
VCGFYFNAFCYAKIFVMAQTGDALTGYPDLVKVNHSIDNTGLISSIGKNLTPGINDQ